jgi:hypothetical protein
MFRYMVISRALDGLGGARPPHRHRAGRVAMAVRWRSHRRVGHCGPCIGCASLPRRRVVARRQIAREHVLASAMPLPPIPRPSSRTSRCPERRRLPCRRRGPVGDRCGRALWARVGRAPDPSGSLPARPVDVPLGRLARDGLCNFGHKANDGLQGPDLPWPHVHYSLERIHSKHRSAPSDDG